MPDQHAVPGLPPPTPRDEEIRRIVADLVDTYAWAEAAAVLRARLSEIATTQETHLERVFRAWCDLPREARPDFLTYAHKRRRPEVEHGR